uniref:RPA1 related single stranded DNA binding protein n=1 Tax=Sparus aurata TaxID=8175 RepID=A0A671X250_SPAAU
MEDNSSSSSVATCQASFLQRTLECLSSSRLKLQTEEAAPVAVTALQRYLCEQAEGQQTDSYSYDVTVTDGVCRAKCFVHPSLNHLVHTNILRTGVDIHITQGSFVYNERRLGHGYICIEQLRCAAGRSAVLPRIKDVSSLPMLVKHGMERSVLLQSDVPLQVSRKHYLSLWNNDDPEGDIWTSGCPPSDTVLDVSKITLLRSLESCFRNTWKPLPLLVKIIHKSRLRYYGKFGLKIDYPYQAYFEVADQSGTMSLVLWNELCPEFYQRLNVGTVLYLQSYTLKQSYSNRSHPQMDHHRMKTFNSIEICLNPRNPTSVITVVSPKSVLPQWGLPEVSYQFITRSELEKLSNNSACDVIGLVTFVGRVERVKSKGNKEKYWTYRWIHAVDGTSGHPFILEVFSSSQPEIFSRICPMTYLVCTQMRVCKVENSLPYLTSSCETETFITGYHKGQPYVSDPKVKSFIQWTKTLKDNVVLQKTAVGGHYCYPRPPQKCTQSMSDPSGERKTEWFFLLRELETLQYREHKRLAIQGQITAVRYVKSPKTTEPQQTQQKEQLQEVKERLCQGLLYQDSVSRRFTFDEKDVLLQWGNLQPTRWAPEQTTDTIPPVVCQGYYRVTILGKSSSGIVATTPPAQETVTTHTREVFNHSIQNGNFWPQCDRRCDMFCLAEDVLETACELEDMHVVCILDLCHLGGDKAEVLISKVDCATPT